MAHIGAFRRRVFFRIAMLAVEIRTVCNHVTGLTAPATPLLVVRNVTLCVQMSIAVADLTLELVAVAAKVSKLLTVVALDGVTFLDQMAVSTASSTLATRLCRMPEAITFGTDLCAAFIGGMTEDATAATLDRVRRRCLSTLGSKVSLVAASDTHHARTL